MSGTVHLEVAGEVAFLVIDNPPVNAGSADIRQALLARVAEVEAHSGVKAAVLIGAGGSFIAGSDLKEFDLPLAPPQLPDVIAAIEGAAKPFVAALHGAALGGGYELALGCDARIAAPKTVVGLPECGLGIIPGAGGTQKLPRLTGKAKAIAWICAGKRVSAPQALDAGMIDAIATGDLRVEAAALALSLQGQKRRVIERALPVEEPAEIEAAAKKAAAQGRNRPHILAAIAHIRAVGSQPADDGLAAERATFQKLRVSDEAKALRHIFFAERAAMRGAPGVKAEARDITTLAVVGAGTMGAGIALAGLQSGFRVILTDSAPAALERAQARIESELEKAVKSGRMSAEAAKAAGSKLSLEPQLRAIAAADVIIEAVLEEIAVKREVFAELAKLAKPGAVLATNTSYLDIDEIASATGGRAADVLGMHFFSPAHVMKLLEVVPGAATSPAVLATGLKLAKLLGKQAVQAGNAFGFIGNRIYAAYRAACEFMLEDGALAHEVDAALEEFGFAMGPFAVGDMSGLDIAWRMRQALAPSRDPSARYVAIPDRLCVLGRLGRKTGAGYYLYPEGGKREIDPEVEAIILAEAKAKGIQRQSLSPEEIGRRALAAIVNEAGLLLAEGVAASAADIDVVMVNGYGFPRWTGGPLHWARSQDPEVLAAECRAAALAAGPNKPIADLAKLGVI